MKKINILFLLAISFLLYQSCTEDLPIEESKILSSSDLPDLKVEDGMLVFNSFANLDLTLDELLVDNIKSIEFLATVGEEKEIQINLMYHLFEKMEWQAGSIQNEEMLYSEVLSNNLLTYKGHNPYWAIANSDGLFKVAEDYYYVNETKMYSSRDIVAIKESLTNKELTSQLLDTELRIIEAKKTNKILTGSLWSDSETISIPGGPNCLILGCCSGPCVPMQGCFFYPQHNCGFEVCWQYTQCQSGPQTFSASSTWTTFKTYYCGFSCPYMNYHVRANHTFTSSRPNANLNSTYRYRLNGTTYTLSGSSGSAVSSSITHNLGLIGINSPEYTPSIYHVSANCTGIAEDGTPVTLN